MTEAMVDSIDFEAGARLIKERFVDASDFTFIFHGDFEIDELKPLILSYVGSLPALHRKETWRDIGLRPPSGIVKRTIYRGIEPQCEVEIYFNAPYEWSRKNVWICNSLGDILSERLRNAVREELGGTYSIFTSAMIEELPWAHSEAMISFACAPERADELIATVFGQIDSLKTFGPSEQSIMNAKASNRRFHEQWMKRNSWWGRQLMETYFRGEDPREIIREPEYGQAIDAASIQDAAKRIFDMNNYALFMRLPEKSVAKGAEGGK